MGKKKEKSAENYSALTMESTFQLQLNEGQEEEINKKQKKHKRKKSSKKEKPDEKPSQAPSQIDSVDTIMVEEDDQEIHIEDVDMEGEDSLGDSNSGMKLIIKTPETGAEKGLKLLPKNKMEKCKGSGSTKKFKKKDGSKGEDDTDSEEERWLDAIESGKLEEVDDELKRIKNPRLMTARQRALMEKRSDGVDDGFATIPAEPLLALPTGFKEKVMTEEMIAKKAIKSKRRREQAIEKREEDKKKTVDRLLKKQDSKLSKGSRSKVSKKAAPGMSYFNNKEGIFLFFPDGSEDTFPIPTLVERKPPKPVICGVEGCFNIKKYSSKAGVPLCSLKCYKKNSIASSVSDSPT